MYKDSAASVSGEYAKRMRCKSALLRRSLIMKTTRRGLARER
jgi:hypothetical protein